MALIAVTGVTGQPVLMATWSAGFDGQIDKPFTAATWPILRSAARDAAPATNGVARSSAFLRALLLSRLLDLRAGARAPSLANRGWHCRCKLDEGFGVGTPSTLRWPLISNARPGDGRQIGSEVLVPRMGKAYRPVGRWQPRSARLG